MRFSPQIDANKSKRSGESLILTLYDNNYTNINNLLVVLDEEAVIEDLESGQNENIANGQHDCACE